MLAGISKSVTESFRAWSRSNLVYSLRYRLREIGDYAGSYFGISAMGAGVGAGVGGIVGGGVGFIDGVASQKEIPGAIESASTFLKRGAIVGAYVGGAPVTVPAYEAYKYMTKKNTSSYQTNCSDNLVEDPGLSNQNNRP